MVHTMDNDVFSKDFSSFLILSIFPFSVSLLLTSLSLTELSYGNRCLFVLMSVLVNINKGERLYVPHGKASLFAILCKSLRSRDWWVRSLNKPQHVMIALATNPSSSVIWVVAAWAHDKTKVSKLTSYHLCPPASVDPWSKWHHISPNPSIIAQRRLNFITCSSSPMLILR